MVLGGESPPRTSTSCSLGLSCASKPRLSNLPSTRLSRAELAETWDFRFLLTIPSAISVNRLACAQPISKMEPIDPHSLAVQVGMLLRVWRGRGGRSRRLTGTPLVSSLMATCAPRLTPLHPRGAAALGGPGGW